MTKNKKAITTIVGGFLGFWIIASIGGDLGYKGLFLLIFPLALMVFGVVKLVEPSPGKGDHK